MSNSGEGLEQLVKLVEEIFVPQGFKVEVRKRIYDDHGNQIAELDVFVSGTLSTTQIEWLIECRDRPSEGPAPGAWIQQLVGRRTTLKLNKVTAVSTTGFSPAAIAFAKQEGIELRSVNQITRAEVETWFSSQSIPFHNVIGDLKQVDIRLAGSDEDKSAIYARLSANPQARLFFPTSGGEPVPMNTLWKQAVDLAPRELSDGVTPNGPPARKQITVEYTNPADRYKVSSNGKDVHITSITFAGDIRVEVVEVPISSITRYSTVQDGRQLAESITFELPLGDDSIDLSLHRVPDKDGAKIVVTARRAN